MLISMTLTILQKQRALFMVVSTPGGSTIITSVFQVVLNVLEFGMTIQETVLAPGIITRGNRMRYRPVEMP
ncbi:MAG: gamma-glutamyltransferase family protein [Opitutales bacterium]|nr:gamma-glutamyltransferase family protein [Opitutales bacterium]